MNYFIDPSLLAKAAESNNNLLNVPDDAARGRGDTYRWSEPVTITRVEMGEDDKGRTAIRVNYRVSLMSNNVSNRGKSTSSRFLLRDKPTEGTGEYTMTIISLANIRSLVHAVVPSYDDAQGLDLEVFFGEQSPLLNKEIVCQVTDKPDRDDPKVRRQELGRFQPMEN